MTKMNQEQMVLYLLKRAGTKGIGCHEFAMKYGILRYGACIFRLRNKGYNITMTNKYVPKKRKIFGDTFLQRQTRYFLQE